MSILGTSYIGATRGARTGQTFQAVNPGNGTSIEPPYHAATSEELDRACRLAAVAFPVYRKQTGRARAAFLSRIADEIEALGDALLERFVAESGLPAGRAQAERARTCGQLRLFADLVREGSWVNARIDHGDPKRPGIPKPDTRWILQALGPVAVFGPANFPLAFAVAGGDAASALAAGCPVVVKAHSSHPGTSELVGDAVRRAVQACGLPEGVFSLLFGPGRQIGTALVQHPAIKAVGFTGSRRAGRELFDLASSRPDPIPFFGELSSLNPVLILPKALEERGRQIVEGLHGSATLGMGQFCTKPGLVLLSKGGASEDFAAQLRESMAATPPGVMLNEATQRAYADGVAQLGAHREVSTLAKPAASKGAGAFAGAAVFTANARTFLHDHQLQEEIFGPATLLVVHESGEELRRVVDKLEGNLTASVFGTPEDFREYTDVIAQLEVKVGRIVFNGYPTGVEVCSSMNHSGPWPATTDCRFTSVGTAAILRWARPVCYQNCPDTLLPAELQEANPLPIWRLVDGEYGR